MRCKKCGEKMVYSNEYLVMSDGVEVGLMKCKQCDNEQTIKEKQER